MTKAKKEVYNLFRELKLKAFQKHFYALASDENLSIEDVMLELCRKEVEDRFTTKVKRRIKQAGFPKIKTLSMLDYKKVPKLPKKTIKQLETCDFIEKRNNVLLLGDSGGGKTHLAIALGIQACQNNYSVKFYTACHLVNDLLKQYKEGNITKFLAKLRKYQFLIVDELGYIPFSKKGAELLFQVFSDRYEAGSIAVTTNLNFSRWTEVFIDKTMTTALLDRIVHEATIIRYDWGSIRFNEALKKQK